MATTEKKPHGGSSEEEVFLAVFGSLLAEMKTLSGCCDRLQDSTSRLKDHLRGIYGFRRLIAQHLDSFDIRQLDNLDHVCRDLEHTREERDALIQAEAERGIVYDLQASATGGGLLTLGKHVFLISPREFEFLRLLSRKDLQDAEGWVRIGFLTQAMKTTPFNVRSIKNRLKGRLEETNPLYAYLIASRPGGYRFLGICDGGGGSCKVEEKR